MSIELDNNNGNSGGGQGGATSYTELGNKPQINGVTLAGNKTADELELVTKNTQQTITGNKTFSGSVDLGDNATAQTKPTSDTSDAVATTKFVKDYAEDGEWQKPADWVDIRSGALDNSVYFLVAHSKPTGTPGSYTIANYSKFAIILSVSSSGSYDVYVDDIKIATTQHITSTTIDFEQLYNDGVLKGGYDVMYPSELTTHVVRITPSDDGNTIVKIRTSLPSGSSSGYSMGCLWVHFEVDYTINIERVLADDVYHNHICQAVTAKNNTLTFAISGSGNTGLHSSFYGSPLKKLPVLRFENSNYTFVHRRDFQNVATKKVVLTNNSKSLSFGILKGFQGQYFVTENPMRLYTGYGNNAILTATNLYNLKRLPAISNEKADVLVMTRLDSLEPTIINESFNDTRTLLRIYGDSSHITNLVGLVVSSSAPFNYATAPQINISYTAMSRDALVRLFNSMPTVSDEQVINITGATGANDLTADDLAIATGKGWSVIR